MSNLEIDTRVRVLPLNPDGSLIVHRYPSHFQFDPGKLALIGGPIRPDQVDDPIPNDKRPHMGMVRWILFNELGLPVKLDSLRFLVTSQCNGILTYSFYIFLDKFFDLTTVPSDSKFAELQAISLEEILEMMGSAENKLAFEHRQIVTTYLHVLEGMIEGRNE